LYQYKSQEANMPHTQILSLPHRRRDSLFLRFAKAVQRATARRAQRQCLAQLDPHLLRDIGLDAVVAAQECAKPIWRP
jgi:uncharacterized protein YjiS (DUF1127 family)